MQKVFERFKELFEKRYSLISVLDLGEDSVRYDFFHSAADVLELNPWEIQLEHPLHIESFIPMDNAKRKRDEKPQMDLWISKDQLKVGFEFAIFKRNKVDGSPGNDTEYIFKVLNDFVRLAIHTHLTNSEAYFVCVADTVMLGKQLWTKKIPKFPGSEYEFNYEALVNITTNEVNEEYKSAKRIDKRFLEKLKKLNLRINAALIFNEQLNSPINNLETRALIWKVTSTIEK